MRAANNRMAHRRRYARVISGSGRSASSEASPRRGDRVVQAAATASAALLGGVLLLLLCPSGEALPNEGAATPASTAAPGSSAGARGAASRWDHAFEAELDGPTTQHGVKDPGQTTIEQQPQRPQQQPGDIAVLDDGLVELSNHFGVDLDELGHAIQQWQHDDAGDRTPRQLQQAAGQWDQPLRELMHQGHAGGPAPATCEDPRADNFGSGEPTCQYDCAALVAHYFPGSSRVTQCFVFDPVTQAWPDSLLSLRQSRLDWHTWVEQDPGLDTISFTVGGPRECVNVTVDTTFLAGEESSTQEVHCLFDGQHQWNHTVDESHTVEVVGYVQSDVHHSAGGITDFVVGECTDAVVRVVTTAASTGASITLMLNDDHNDGPWNIDVPMDGGVFEHVVCLFDNDYTLDVVDLAGGWVGTLDVIAFVSDNTIYIPRDQDWIIQGGYADGLPAVLDARLESGSNVELSHASLVVRYTRFTNQLATLLASTEGITYGLVVSRTCHGDWCAARNGGALRFVGGDDSTIISDHCVWDHNQASGGGAWMLDHGKRTTVKTLHTLFWYNQVMLPGSYGGAVRLINMWPLYLDVIDTQFIDNDSIAVKALSIGFINSGSGLAGSPEQPHDGVGFTRFQNVYVDSALRPMRHWPVPGVGIIMFMYVGGPNTGQDFRVDVALSNCTFEHTSAPKHRAGGFYIFNPQHHAMDVQIEDSSARDNHGDFPSNVASSCAIGSNGLRSDMAVEVRRCRFESNGNLNEASAGLGGGLASHGSQPGAQYRLADSVFSGNTASQGGGFSFLGDGELSILRCMFDSNRSWRGGGAVQFTSTLGSILVESSFFLNNAVQYEVLMPDVDVTVGLYTGHTSAIPPFGVNDERCINPNAARCINPIWKMDGATPSTIDGSVPTGEVVYGNTTAYLPETTYSEVLRLSIGEHTLWTGAVLYGPTLSDRWTSGSIQIYDIIEPFVPEYVDNRASPDENGFARHPGCQLVAAGGVEACVVGQAFWSARTFQVGEGGGGAIAATTTASIRIENTVFRDNAAWLGKAVDVNSASDFFIRNTTHEPFQGAIAAQATAQQDCQVMWETRCATGERCEFQTGSVFCTPCEVTQIGDGISCTTCAPGKAPNDDQSTCDVCLSGQYSRYGTCTDCPAGRTSTADRTVCAVCPQGKYRSLEPAMEACAQCSPGTQPNSGQSECEPCYAPGTYSADGSSCERCPGGREPSGNATALLFTECVDCSAGRFSNGGARCDECPAGTQSTTDRSVCTPCDDGTYRSSDGASCTPCSPGYQPNEPKTGCDPCLLIARDSVSPDGRQCQPCPARNQPNGDQTACACTKGTYDVAKLGLIHCHGAAQTAQLTVDDQCVVCPDCMSCDRAGVATLREGWHFFETGQAYQCPLPEACPDYFLDNFTSTTKSTCAEGCA